MASYPPPFGYDARQQKQFAKDQARAQKMAFQAQRDLYRAQVRSMRRSSILGPLVLVGAGVVLLLIKLGKLPADRFGAWYAHWWPLLLVVAGLVMLAEWALDQQTKADGTLPVRRRVGGGVIFLLVILAVSGAALQGVKDAHDTLFAHGFTINPDNMAEFFGEKHDLPEQRIDQAFAPGTSLSIDNAHGDVSVTGGSTDGQIHIVVNKQVYASDAAADQKGTDLSPRVLLNGNVMSVTLAAVDGGISNVSVTLPEMSPVTVNANHGQISVMGVKSGVTLTSNHGDVDVKQVAGGVRAQINHGDSSFSAMNVVGDVSLKGRAQDVTATDIAGGVSLDGDFYGDTHLEHVHGPLLFQTSRTHFTLAKLDGMVDINSSDLSGSQIVGPVDLKVRSRNITFERVAGDVAITNTNGQVDVTSASPVGVISIENTKGEVNLTVPEGAGMQVQADSNGGDIENDMALTANRSHENSTLLGTVGNGAGKVRISTTHGDIRIRKGVVAGPVEVGMPGVVGIAPLVPLTPIAPLTPKKGLTRPTKGTTPTKATTPTAPTTPTTPTSATTPTGGGKI